MTRINVVPVEELTDKHLLAEYRELPRVSALAARSKMTDWAKIPKDYTLGTGHVKFFYNKGGFLKNRFENQIVPEMQRRGFVTNFIYYRPHPAGLNQQYTPTKESLNINRKRIKERLANK